MNASDPLVSVLIPTLNAEDYIDETITSVLNQSYGNFEIVVVDDGSTDGTYDAAKKYESGNVKIHRQINKGACSARNAALGFSEGVFVQYLDSDDLMRRDKIEKQMEVLSGRSGAISFCPHRFFRDGEDPYASKVLPEDELFFCSFDSGADFLEHLYGLNQAYRFGMVPTHAWLAPRSVIDRAGGWNEDLASDQDGEFFCRVALASEGVLCVKETDVYYRKGREGSISTGRRLRHWESRLRALELKRNHLGQYRNLQALKKYWARGMKDIAVATYPEYKAFSKQVLERMEQLGGSDYVPVLGGDLLETVKHRFGWRVARRLSHLKRLVI